MECFRQGIDSVLFKLFFFFWKPLSNHFRGCLWNRLLIFKHILSDTWSYHQHRHGTDYPSWPWGKKERGKSHINLLSAQPDIVNVQIIGMWMHAWMRRLKNGLINNLKNASKVSKVSQSTEVRWSHLRQYSFNLWIDCSMIYRWAQTALSSSSHCCVIEPDVGSIAFINIYRPLSEGQACFGCVTQVTESWRACWMKHLHILRRSLSWWRQWVALVPQRLQIQFRSKGLPPHSPKAHTLS